MKPSPSSQGQIRIPCPCGQVLNAAPEHRGRRVRCRCGREHVVRAARPRLADLAKRLSRRFAGGTALAAVRSLFRPRASRPAPPVSGRRRRLRAWTGLLATGYLALVILVAIGLWTLADRWWPATVLLFGPRWVLLLPLAILVPAAAVWRRRSLGPLALATLVVLVPIMGWRLGWRPWRDAARRPGDIRVVSFNVAGRPGLALAVVLYDWDADVVAVQECQADAIPDQLLTLPGWQHHLAGPMCLFSRFAITEVDSVTRWRAGPLGTSGYAWSYRLLPPGGESFTMVNVHLETPRKGFEPLQQTADPTTLVGNTEVREIGSRRLRRWVDSLPAPMVIAGDFNMPVESRIYRAYWSGLGNAFSQVGNGFGGTRDMIRFRVRIDHILFDRGWQAVHAEPGHALGSDHLPMVADLRRRSTGF